MIQINLLPIRARKKKETARQFIAVYILSLILAIAVIGYLWISQKNEIAALKSKQSQVQQEVNKYAKYEKILQEITKQKELVDKKRTIILDLQKDRDEVVRALAVLSVEVPPEKIWLDKLVKSGDNFTLSGFAVSNEAIVEFMKNLESSPYIGKGNVSLTRSRQSLVSSAKLREFELKYHFLPFSQVENQLKVQRQ